MSPSELPSDVRQLLKEQIRSIEQLEILLLLRDAPERNWSADEVYQKVRSSERSVIQTLEELSNRGLLVHADEEGLPRFRFSPRTAPLKETVDRLAQLYAERRVRIVEAIYSDRVSAVNEFAKAFRLRKDSNG
ncbi:MAG TPA: hypothetical protein VK327_14600 [Candidatus Paceibacterota bacterium]|nr:hypothetical protein [Candidatus Paceibacterota bacterium]